MNRQTGLRRILISRFIITISIVAVIEYLVFLFINKVALPIAMDIAAPRIGMLENMDLGSVLVGILFLLIVLALRLISVLFPTLRSLVDYLVIEMTHGLRLEEGAAQSLDIKTTAVFLLVLFLILVMAIVPYVVGAIAYTGMVSSEISKLDQEIRKEHEETEKARYLMISDIVHDLKTPMTTVTGYAKAINEGMVRPEDQKEYLEAITNKSERMNEIVNLLFDYVKLDSEGFTIDKAKLDVCELVREQAAFLYTDIEDAGDELDVDIPDGSIFINADKLQFSRVVTNLIVNAVKHNPRGTKIGVFIRDEYEDRRIYIADSGNKIASDIAESLFEPFVMGDKSRKSSGGTGLGLSITKKICDMHGFKVKLVQKPDMNRYELGGEYNKVFVIIMDA
ncbi:MAG: HAMP domain-containing histidine kinase [Saccharofermentans sp.]|nr:HAMP domain-containing histidine kinase [Saccharofermentans sp.]